MSMPFNYSAAKYAEDKRNIPSIMPGKPYDRTDLEAVSAVPVGGPGVYGRVMIQAPSFEERDTATRFASTRDAQVCLPDFLGEHLKTESGVLYKDAYGDFDVYNQAVGASFAGIGIFTEAGMPHPCQGRLAQPFGLGDKFYQPEKYGQMSLAKEGNIWCYTESDVEVGDQLAFFASVSDTSDGIQLIGSFCSDEYAFGTDRDYQLFSHGKVIKGGPAGGLFVLSLNGAGTL